MKTIQTITTEDVTNLRGQLIVQLNHSDNETKIINNSNIEFYSIKRISLVTQISNEKKGEPVRYGMINMFYNGRNTFGTAEEFVEEFNAIGKDRYYRLLTPEETNLFNKYMLTQRTHI